VGALFIFFGGVMKKVDKLGRIVIPIEVRQKYRFTEGTKIEFLDVGEGLIIRSSEHFCKICREKIPDGETFPLCEKCMVEVIKRYHDKN
jgi:AbrB family looped-hinge helix DNA binding protein